MCNMYMLMRLFRGQQLRHCEVEQDRARKGGVRVFGICQVYTDCTRVNVHVAQCKSFNSSMLCIAALS